ncbi:MAG: site-specific integrase [Herminiimonas sp.]|nr:site-specific integrase [Herminiimonas sp.]
MTILIPLPDLHSDSTLLPTPDDVAADGVPADLPGTKLYPADIASRQRAFLAAATADNTRRAYRGALRHFLAWGGALPADEASLLRYLLDFAATLNARTLALRLTALSQWHVQQGFNDPAASHTVRKTLTGISRTYGSPARKAIALQLDDLERIATHLAGLDTLVARRNNALLQAAYFGAFRRSEVVGLTVAHLQWEPQGVVIQLARSKTDQHGGGMVKAIPYGDGACCPATALRDWLDAGGISAGPVFRSISKWGVIGERALHAGSVNTILAECALAARVRNAAALSSHSLRRGMATSAWRAGASLRDIKRQGGWRNDAMVQGYIDDADRFDDNAAAPLLRKKR